MQTAPNSTVITGRPRRFIAAADLYGGVLEIEVSTNESPNAAADFLKPKPGQILSAFLPPDNADKIAVMGRLCRIRLTFLGGPSGGQALIQEIELL